MNWIELSEDRIHWWGFMNTIKNLLVTKQRIYWIAISCSRKIDFCGVRQSVWLYLHITFKAIIILPVWEIMSDKNIIGSVTINTHLFAFSNVFWCYGIIFQVAFNFISSKLALSITYSFVGTYPLVITVMASSLILMWIRNIMLQVVNVDHNGTGLRLVTFQTLCF